VTTDDDAPRAADRPARPWWLWSDDLSPRAARAATVCWLLLAVIGAVQVVIADSSTGRWLGGLQALAGLAAVAMVAATARRLDG
jgi:hypothetical protein